MKKLLYSVLALSLLFSCSNDDDGTITLQEPLGDYENGIIVSAEGGPSSVSYISNDFSTSENDIYFNVNGETLGVYLQSMGFNGDNAYIIQDSGTITVVNRYTFELVTTITTGLTLPRYIGFNGSTAYVSDWADPNTSTDDYVAVIDLNSYTVTSTIPVSEGPEQVLANNGKVFVSHKGGYGVNNEISVISTSNSTVATISVNDVPDEMVLDSQGNLLVLSEGGQSWQVSGETLASITRINTSDNSIISTVEFASGNHPSLMSYFNGMAYYILNNEVYALADTATNLPSSSLFSVDAGYAYGLSVKENNLFLTDASFSAQSTLKVYDLPSGTLSESFSVGIGASKIYFN
mgnify:FL=1